MKNLKKRILTGILALSVAAAPIAAYASSFTAEGTTDDTAGMYSVADKYDEPDYTEDTDFEPGEGDPAAGDESVTELPDAGPDDNEGTGDGGEEENDADIGTEDEADEVVPDEADDLLEEEPEGTLDFDELYNAIVELWNRAAAMEDSEGAQELWDELMAIWEQIYAAEEEGTSGLTDEEMAALDALTEQIYERLLELGFDPYALVTLDAIDSYENLKKAINGQTGLIEITLSESFATDGTEHITLEAGAEVSIDLNGYTITADDLGGGSLFTVPSGAELTITDSRAVPASRGDGTYVGATDAGLLASVSGSIDSGLALTYYVTESTVTNSATGATQEIRYAYTAYSYGMVCTTGQNHSLFSVTGGTLNILSGFIYGENTSSGNRAIDASAGTVNLSGGYICGFSESYSNGHGEDYDGGAVRATGDAVINISGDAVLAANKAATGGAVDVANGAVLNMSGGVISGNEASEEAETSEWNNDYGGGGIHAYGYGTVVTISGGYLTNNVSDCTGYFDGGGGILVNGATLYFSGGYITGNRAASGGGGIRTSFAAYGGQMKSSVYITGGYLCANYAGTAEGGGLCLDNGSYSEITAASAIYINNNETDTSEHWGGGGVFCANGATLYMSNALVTGNSAGGFGGGVAGCSTGRIAMSHYEGAAVYSNAAAGQHTSGSSSTKHDDTEYALNDRVFIENGYQDYYCALESMVAGAMLGGGSAGWHGSADGSVVDNVGIDEYVWASYIMGLTANPGSDAIAAAQSAAKVYVNGNSSYTHGGGVLSNGYLFIGSVIDYELGDALQVNADKQLKNQYGESENVGEDQFTFEITDENGEVVSTGTTQSDGSIFFKRRLSFKSEGTFTYYIRETLSDDPSITTDQSVYMLVVTVGKTSEQIEVAGQTVNYIYYNVNHVRLTKDDDAEVLLDRDIYSSDDAVATVTIPSPAFVNYERSYISITVHKTWLDENGESIGWPDDVGEITVHLYRNEEIYDTVTLTESNSSYTWTDLPVSETDAGGNTVTYVYEVKEDGVAGFMTSYETSDSSKEVKSFWVPVSGSEELRAGEKYLIVSPDGLTALALTGDHVNSQFTEADSASITPGEGELAIGSTTYDSWYAGESVADAMIWLAVTTTGYDSATFEHLILKNVEFTESSLLVQGGSQYYTGLKGCTGDIWASAMMLDGDGRLLGQDDNSGWSASNPWSYIVYVDGRFNSGIGSDESAKVYKLIQPITESSDMTIINQSGVTYGFELNKTDGSGGMLDGAEFELKDEASETLYFIQDGDVYTLCDKDTAGASATVTAGAIRIEGLYEGTYYLCETDAPDGYIKLSDPVIITVTAEGVIITGESDTGAEAADDWTLIVKNTEALVLPNMGGTGDLRIILIGLALVCGGILCGAAMTLRRKRA